MIFVKNRPNEIKIESNVVSNFEEQYRKLQILASIATNMDSNTKETCKPNQDQHLTKINPDLQSFLRQNSLKTYLDIVKSTSTTTNESQVAQNLNSLRLHNDHKTTIVSPSSYIVA